MQTYTYWKRFDRHSGNESYNTQLAQIAATRDIVHNNCLAEYTSA